MLAQWLEELLAAAKETLQHPPDRRYVSHGPPLPDCEQLTVHALAVRVVQTPGNRCSLEVVYPLVVSLLRPIPTPDDQGAPPAAAALTASGKGLAEDGAALLDGLLDAGTGIFTGLSCAEILWTPGLAPWMPAGALAGWTLGLELHP